MFDKEEFKRKYEELGLSFDTYFDSFPFESEVDLSELKHSEWRYTYRLYNGLMISTHVKGTSNLILAMNVYY